MQPTRRNLIVGGVALTALTSTSAFAHLKNGWQIVGGNKFALSREEAMRRLPEALTRMKFPVAAEKVQAVITANPNGMRRSTLQVGQPNLLAMVSGKGEVDFDVALKFRSLAVGVQPPILDTTEWDVGDYVLILPDICFNWCYRHKVKLMIAPVASCECCVQVRYKLPPGMQHVSYAVFGPYPLDLAKCGHLGQWDRGCVEHNCFQDAIETVIKVEEDRGVQIDRHWMWDGSYTYPQPTTTEELHALWFPHEVVNGFGLIVCMDSGYDPRLGRPAQEMKFNYLAWKDPYTRERMWHLDDFQLYEG